MDDKTSPMSPAPHEAPLTDHEYDGIQEYDNPMPRWWLWMFWACFYFAVCYVLYFHVYMKGPSIAEEYAADMRTYREEMAQREVGTTPTEESLGKLMSNAAVMADAETLFKIRCVQCHAANGQGLIGPNLTDDHWIHGKGALLDIYKVVDEGVLTKGMPAWGKQLSRIEVSKVVAYVGSIRGKNLPGKPPEGEKVGPVTGPATGG
jgi:cytochrome c oxidase cbb3-type subunit 3